MLDPRQVTPLLNYMTVIRQIGKGPDGSVYLLKRVTDDKKMAVKHISIPESEEKTKALLYSGAVRSEAEAQRYYKNVVDDLKNELLLLNNIKNAANLHKYRGYQVDQKLLGVGYDFYLLADYSRNLVNYLDKPISKVNAVNLGIDLAAALEQLRSGGLVHKDVHLGNIFAEAGNHFSLGDLGVCELSDIRYTTIPDSMITAFTAPEVLPAEATLSSTMDIYSVGVILYMIYNGNELPLDAGGHFANSAEQAPEAPAYADQAMSEIILKACAYRPEDRYQTPTELKEALVLYAQRGDVSDAYLVPQPDLPDPEPAPEPTPEPERAPETDAAEAAPVTGDTIVVPVITEEDTAAAAVSGDTMIMPPVTAGPELLARGAATAAAEGAVVGALGTLGSDELMLPGSDFTTGDADGALGHLEQDSLLLPTTGEISVEDFLASYRQRSGLEVYSMDESGNMVSVPYFEKPADDDTCFVESADDSAEAEEPEILAAAAETQPDEDASADLQDSEPEPVKAPAVPAFTPAPAYDPGTPAITNIDELVNSVAAHINAEIPLEPEVPPVYTQPAIKIPQPVPTPAPAASAAANTRYDDEYDDEDEYEDEDEDEDDEEESSGSAWKKVLVTIIVLLVLAAGAFGFYYFKTDTVSAVNAEAVSSTSVLVSADTKNSSGMNVVCSTATGDIDTVPLENGSATFTNLSPNTTYTFTLNSTEGKVLLGSKTTSQKTSQMTNLNAFSAVSYSAVSATLSLSGTGPQPESWLLTITSDSGEVTTAEVTGTEFEISDLTPETNYTVSIEKGDGDILGGTTACSFTTQEYTVLSSFETTALTTNSMSLQWAFTGTTPDVWTLNCEGTDGSVTTQSISGTDCTLNGLTAGTTYTLSLGTPSLKPAENSTLVVAIPAITVNTVSASVDADGDIAVTWDYTGDVTPAQWRISYSYDDSVEPVTVTSDTNSITLTDLIPSTSYKIAVVGADDLTVGGEANAICTSGAANPYTNYGCTDATLTLYVLEDNEDNLTTSSTVFTTEQHIAFAIEVSYDETEEDKTAATLYVIRNSAGVPVHVYNSSRTWSGTWTTAKHTGDLPDTLSEPGSYTLEVYFDGCLMASTAFTVN